MCHSGGGTPAPQGEEPAGSRLLPGLRPGVIALARGGVPRALGQGLLPRQQPLAHPLDHVGVPVGEVYGQLQKANRLPELERAIREEKVFEYLLSQSTVEEVKS